VRASSSTTSSFDACHSSITPGILDAMNSNSACVWSSRRRRPHHRRNSKGPRTATRERAPGRGRLSRAKASGAPGGGGPVVLRVAGVDDVVGCGDRVR
jgi:hypothetical protein